MRREIFSSSKNEILNIGSIGYSDDIKVTHYGPTQRKLYIIHYVLSGKGYFNGNPIKAGQGFLIHPDMYEHYYADKENPWSFIWIISDDKKMRSVFEWYNADCSTKIFEYDNIKTLERTRDFLLSSPHSIYDSVWMLEYFLHILNNRNKLQKSNENSADMYFDYAVRYINLNIFKPVRVSELSRALGISQPYLYKIFTEKCGVPPKKYISLRKADEAKRLLSETTLTINEISLSVGYENVLDFFKFFKKTCGITPTQYRKS